jgi:hypothetical protein
MIEALEAVRAGRGWAGGTAPIGRLMAELYRDPAAAVAVIEAAQGEDTVAEPAITAPLAFEALAASGAIPPHAIAIASAPTAPKRTLARGSTRISRATAAAAYQQHTRELWLDDEDARTRGRRTLKRPGTAPKLAA